MVNFEDIDRGNKIVNLVNLEDENFKKIGLKPLYFHQVPLFINLNDNIFYGGSNHSTCDLRRDVALMLSGINAKQYDRYESINELFGLQDNLTLKFIIYNNKIYFNNPVSYYAYKTYPHISKEIIEKFGISPNFYEPTREELLDFYLTDKSYFKIDVMRETGNYVDWNNVKRVNYNLTPREALDLIYSKLQYTPFTDSKELSGMNVRFAINCNANIFMESRCSLNTTGVYNENAMHIINNLYETKHEISKSLYEFACKSKDMKKLVHDLLVELNVYHEYVKEPDSHVSPFDLSFGGYEEQKEKWYWKEMFLKAANSILVQVIGFDKIETSRSKTITTTKPNIYEEFYNFILMDYDIVRIPKLVFDEDTQLLRWVEPNEYVTTAEDRECEEELSKIKKYVPYKDRHLFMRR